MHSELLLKGPSLRYISRYSYHAASSGETAAHLSFSASTPPLISLLKWMSPLIQRCLFKPCFDTQPMAFPSEINNYWPAAPHCPSPRPSAPQHLCLHLCLHLHLCLRLHLFHCNYPSTIQYNWLESETQCALMHSVLNSWRDRLWFNRLKDTETWSWNVMQCFESHTSPLPSPPCTPPSLHHLHLHLCCLHLCCLHLCKKKILH